MLERPIEEATAADAGPSRRRFSAHVAWTFGARILMTVNSVAAGVIVARWLGAEGLGQLAVINVAVATVVQLGSAGLPSANTYFIARAKKDFAPAAVNSLLFATMAGGLLALGLWWLATLRPGWFGFIPPRLVAIAALSVPFQLVTLIGLNVFLAVGRVERFNLLDLLGQSFVLVNAAVALVILNAGLWTLISLNTAAGAAVGLLIAALVWTYGAKAKGGAKWRPDLRLFGRMMRYGVKSHVASLAAVLIFRADILVVNLFRGAGEAGVYSVASQVALMLFLLPSVVATLLFPRIASKQDERGELTCLVTRHMAFVMLVVCLAAVPAGYALPALYGADFAEAVVLLLILLPGVYLVGLESVLVQYFNAAGLPRAIPLFWVATLLFNVALTFALVPVFGARGAAAASTLSYAMIFALVVFYFHRRTGQTLAAVLVPRRAELMRTLAAGRPGALSR
ncbi:MAG TPA: flippase [Pyrinomonadaceae bacterium]|nr:flippase [Pyrinomonadaceae bacterium]